MKSIDSCNVEAGVVKTWVNFIEDTCQLQSSYNEQKENKTKYLWPYKPFASSSPLFLLHSHLSFVTL
jgi:hypothetical protein